MYFSTCQSISYHHLSLITRAYTYIYIHVYTPQSGSEFPPNHVSPHRVISHQPAVRPVVPLPSWPSGADGSRSCMHLFSHSNKKTYVKTMKQNKPLGEVFLKRLVQFKELNFSYMLYLAG